MAIGDELTSGQRLDTNSQWLSQRLGDLGVPVVYHSTVGDSVDRMREVFRCAAERADIIISTGGLGPTADDLTRDVLADLAGTELILDEKSLRHIEALFRLRKRAMPERNRLQAMFPQGSQVIANPHGTAPGIDFDLSPVDGLRGRWIALPGVPAEMHAMWQESVIGIIKEIFPQERIIVHRAVRCFGAGESHIESLLPDLIARGREPIVGITASSATITLRITTSGRDEKACEPALDETEKLIVDTLGELVFGRENEEVHDAVVSLLEGCNLTLACAEAGTDGQLTKFLMETQSPRIAECRAAARWSLLAKDDNGAPLADLGNAVAELATSHRLQSGANLALVIVAPPALTDPPDEVFVAIASGGETLVKAYSYAAPPNLRNTLAVKRAMNTLRLALLRGEVS